MNEQLVNYIRENLAKGVTQDQIRQTLLTSGWQSADVDAAFLQLQSPQSANLPTQPVNPPKSAFNLKFLVIGFLAVLLLASAGGGAYLYFNKKTEPASQQTHQSLTNETQNDINNDTSKELEKLKKSWNDCKIHLSELDYLPQNLGSFVAEERAQTNNVFSVKYVSSTETSAEKIFSLVLEKSKSSTEKLQESTDYYNNNLNKELDAFTVISAEKTKVLGSIDALLTLQKQDLNETHEIVRAKLSIAIPVHEVFASFAVERRNVLKQLRTTVNADLLEYYQTWFFSVCK